MQKEKDLLNSGNQQMKLIGIKRGRLYLDRECGAGQNHVHTADHGLHVGRVADQGSRAVRERLQEINVKRRKIIALVHGSKLDWM